jgi:hypothetical protein
MYLGTPGPDHPAMLPILLLAAAGTLIPAIGITIADHRRDNSAPA